MRRLRQDLDWFVSAGLLLSVAASAATGVVADLWDLNDFWYHTVAGYVMGGFAIAHVLFNWERLVGYARFRLRSVVAPSVDPRTHRPAARPVRAGAAGVEPAPAPGSLLRKIAISRRGLLGFAAGGLGGWAIGRGLRPPPQISAGSDVGVVYHQWSKPGIIDAFGSVANWGQFPELYKTYPDAARVALPEPSAREGPAAAEAILARRSTRSYSTKPMTLPELSQ
ncbi:MAG: DUF4405 domain-containing protein, partial [Candidatus Limnocylindria bacterium]